MEKRALKPKICRCGVEFVPRFSFQKHCSSKCRYEEKHERERSLVHCLRCGGMNAKSKLKHGRCTSCNDELRKDRRGGPTTFGGKEWDDTAKEVRRVNDNSCCICGKKTVTGIPVDHIIPRRKMEQMGLNPHIIVNLACLCDFHHGVKTGIEGYLFDGDMIGYCQELAGMNYPIERVSSAFHAAGFNEKLLKRIYGGIS